MILLKKGEIVMALPDSEINAVFDQFNQRCLEDPEFARLAEELSGDLL